MASPPSSVSHSVLSAILTITSMPAIRGLVFVHLVFDDGNGRLVGAKAERDAPHFQHGKLVRITGATVDVRGYRPDDEPLRVFYVRSVNGHGTPLGDLSPQDTRSILALMDEVTADHQVAIQQQLALPAAPEVADTPHEYVQLLVLTAELQRQLITADEQLRTLGFQLAQHHFAALTPDEQVGLLALSQPEQIALALVWVRAGGKFNAQTIAIFEAYIQAQARTDAITYLQGRIAAFPETPVEPDMTDNTRAAQDPFLL